MPCVEAPLDSSLEGTYEVACLALLLQMQKLGQSGDVTIQGHMDRTDPRASLMFEANTHSHSLCCSVSSFKCKPLRGGDGVGINISSIKVKFFNKYLTF